MTERLLLDPDLEGLLTARSAVAQGWSYADLARAVRKGYLKRLISGAYVLPERWAQWDEREQHVAHARARLLTREPSWAAARRTAAVIHGWPLLGPLPKEPQLLRPWTGSERASSRFARVATLEAGDVTLRRAMRVTSPARTVVDLAREESFRSAVVIADAALRAGMRPVEASEVLARCSHWPGAARARRVLAFADGRAESVLESVSRVAVRGCGLPDFEPQVEVWVGARRVARVDGFWREWNLVGEADGKGKYREDGDVYAEKVRQDELDDLGLTVVRWDWDDAWRPRGVLDRKILRYRDRALARTVDPRVRLVSTTLEQSWERAARDARRAA